MDDIKIICFDADDTLWVNEPYFREAEKKFCNLLKEYKSKDEILNTLYKIEMDNIPLYGYGIKSFLLAMIETIAEVTNNKADINMVNKAIGFGKEIFSKPIDILEGVKEVLDALKDRYLLVVATKGDLLDQERKLYKSGLADYFHHIEIMSNKEKQDYSKLLKHLDCNAKNFLMVGNSIKSDIIPVLKLGGNAIHIPFHTTWIHEHVEDDLIPENYVKVENIKDVIPYLMDVEKL